MTQEGAALRSVNLTEARNLSPLFDEAMRHEQPVLIVRNRREWGVLVSRDAMLRLLESYVRILADRSTSGTIVSMGVDSEEVPPHAVVLASGCERGTGYNVGEGIDGPEPDSRHQPACAVLWR